MVVVWVVSQSGLVLGGVLVEFEVSPEGMCHEPSPARASMSLTVREGPAGLSKPCPTSPWEGGFARCVWSGVLPSRIWGR